MILSFAWKLFFFWKVLLNIFDQWPVLPELILRVGRFRSGSVSLRFTFLSAVINEVTEDAFLALQFSCLPCWLNLIYSSQRYAAVQVHQLFQFVATVTETIMSALVSDDGLLEEKKIPKFNTSCRTCFFCVCVCVQMQRRFCQWGLRRTGYTWISWSQRSWSGWEIYLHPEKREPRR